MLPLRPASKVEWAVEECAVKSDETAIAKKMRRVSHTAAGADQAWHPMLWMKRLT